MRNGEHTRRHRVKLSNSQPAAGSALGTASAGRLPGAVAGGSINGGLASLPCTSDTALVAFFLRRRSITANAFRA